MVAATYTIRDINQIVLQHISKDRALALLEDLLQIEGNKSFKDTIKLLDASIKDA